MYVFRDGRRTVEGRCIREGVLRALREFGSVGSEDACLAALVAAGELECGVSDARAHGRLEAQCVTDVLADQLVGTPATDASRLEEVVARLSIPETMSLSVAEGFAFYALHPQRLLPAVREIGSNKLVKVIGIRSIGTTLSAVVAAAFRKLGCETERITVRPTGHPYNRKLELTAHERQWIQNRRNGVVVIIDEGPGLSGSSFLAVAEAVEAAGGPAEQIVMLGTRVPEISQLRATDAARRWPKFRFLTADPDPVIPVNAKDALCGGQWRRAFLRDLAEQPASWNDLESAKYTSQDGCWLFKFHGYGHYGEALAARAHKLWRAGFGPEFAGLERGFGVYRIEQGRPLTSSDLNPEILARIAEYCAFRGNEFSTDRSQDAEIEKMARWNWQCEFGDELQLPLRLRVERCVIADGRMQPHEWIRSEDGGILKTDAVSHGDDHFFPGPCDIAWDLAGAIVEWEMDERNAAEFLQRYCELSGDDPRLRLKDYLLAYAVFRMGWSKMAMQASAGSFDEQLLRRDCERYRAVASRLGAAQIETGEARGIAIGNVAGLEPAAL